jgi:hypothetical protein
MDYAAVPGSNRAEDSKVEEAHSRQGTFGMLVVQKSDVYG